MGRRGWEEARKPSAGRDGAGGSEGRCGWEHRDSLWGCGELEGAAARGLVDAAGPRSFSHVTSGCEGTRPSFTQGKVNPERATAARTPALTAPPTPSLRAVPRALEAAGFWTRGAQRFQLEERCRGVPGEGVSQPWEMGLANLMGGKDIVF